MSIFTNTNSQFPTSPSGGSGGTSEAIWNSIIGKPDYLDRIATDAVFYMKGDGTNVGDIVASINSGEIQYLELMSELPDVWGAATITDINLANHGSLNDRLESMENAREFAGGLNPNDGYGALADATSGQYWLVDTAGTLDGIVMGINDMVICSADVTGTPITLTNFAHLASTINAMVGCDGSTDGVIGSVPKPIAGQQNSVLNGAGVWVNTVELETVKSDDMITEDIKITTGTPEADQVLTSDADGNGAWQFPTKLISPDETNNLIVTDDDIESVGYINVKDPRNATTDRIKVEDDATRLYTYNNGLGTAPAQIYAFCSTTGEPSIAMYDGNADRVKVTEEKTWLASPDEDSNVTVSDLGVGIEGDMDIYKPDDDLTVALNGGLGKTSTLQFSENGDPYYALVYDGSPLSPNNTLKLKASPSTSGSLSNTVAEVNQEGSVLLGNTLTVTNGIISPDETNKVEVTDLGVGINADVDVYGDDGVAIALNGGLNKTSSVYFSEVGNPRFAIQYDGSGASPNNLLYIKASPASAGSLSNTALTVNQNGKIILGDTLTVENGIISPDENKSITLLDTGLKYSDTVDRLIIDDTKSKLTSPNGAGNLSFADDGFVCNDGANDRFKVTGTETYVSSPDETNTLSVTDTETKVIGDLTLYNAEGINVKINNSVSKQGNIFFQESSNTYFGINHDAAGSSPNNKLHIKASSNTDGVLDVTALTLAQNGDITLEKDLSVVGDLEVTGNVKKGYGQASFSGVCTDDTSLPMLAERSSDGSIVTFDTSANTFTLKGGKTYRIDIVLGATAYAAITDNLAFRITEADSTSMLGVSGRMYPLGSTEARSSQPVATAIVSPTSDTTYRGYAHIAVGTVTLGSYYSGVTITEL